MTVSPISTRQISILRPTTERQPPTLPTDLPLQILKIRLNPPPPPPVMPCLGSCIWQQQFGETGSTDRPLALQVLSSFDYRDVVASC